MSVNFQKSLYQYMISDIELSKLVDNKIYFNNAVQNISYPFVVAANVDFEAMENNLECISDWVSEQWQFDCISHSRETSGNIAFAINDMFKRFVDDNCGSGIIGDYQIYAVEINSVNDSSSLYVNGGEKQDFVYSVTIGFKRSYYTI